MLATDAAAAFNFAFLEAVAALPELTLFDLNSSTVEYTPYTPPRRRPCGQPTRWRRARRSALRGAAGAFLLP